MPRIQVAKEDHGNPDALQRAFARASRKQAIEDAVAAERARCARMVPTNWCDELLTGKDAPNLPLDQRGVERLLRGVQDRIRNQEK